MALGTRRKSSDKLAQFPVNFPSGTVIAFAGASAPEGWALCNGALLNRTTNAALYAAIGDAHGNGDGSTTFHLPDYRGSFLRGKVDITTKAGSGSAATNNATFTAHGVNRTGFKLRLSSGTLTGLAINTDYYAIVIDSNTLAFATTYANAIAGTKISISGTNSAIITQYQDPDYSSRLISNVGGNSGNDIGSRQEDAMQDHKHFYGAGDTSEFGGYIDGAGAFGSTNTAGILGPATNGTAGAPRVSHENRPKNLLVNYIIKL